MSGRITAVAASLGAACLVVLPIGLGAAPSQAAAPAACADTGYGYAGLASTIRANGIAATITALAHPRVADGHAAGWVGVGSRAERRWLQIGLAAYPGRPLRVYVEHVTPGGPRRYVELAERPRVGSRYAVAVVELGTRPGWWQAFLGRRRIGKPVDLGNIWGEQAIATAESWVGVGHPCNALAFRFERVRLGEEGAWRLPGRATRIRTPGFRLVTSGPDTFVASRAVP